MWVLGIEFWLYGLAINALGGGVVVVGWGGEDNGGKDSGGGGGRGGRGRGCRDSVDGGLGGLGACAAVVWELFFYRIFCFSSL